MSTAFPCQHNRTLTITSSTKKRLFLRTYHVLRNSSPFMELKDSLLWSREPITHPHLDPTLPHSIPLRFILILCSHLCTSPKWFFPCGFYSSIPHTPSTNHMPYLSHPLWVHNHNNIWRRVKIIKFLIMEFSPASSYVLLLRHKYSPYHTVLKHCQSTFLSTCDRSHFTHTKNMQGYRFF
jgi:hypothetical protein